MSFASDFILGSPLQIMAPSTPSAIFGANLVAWYNANSGVSLSGSNVTAWADQSGNARNLSNTGTGNPTFSGSGFNSKPGITLAASANQLSSAAFNINSATLSAFMVVNTPSSYGADSRWLAYTDPTGSLTDFGSAAAILFFASYSVTGGFEGFQNSVTCNQTVAPSTNARCGYIYNGPATTNTPYLNAMAGATTTPGNNTVGNAAYKLYFGANPTGTTAQAGLVVAEIVIANVVASGGQITSLDNYFRSTWGL